MNTFNQYFLDNQHCTSPHRRMLFIESVLSCSYIFSYVISGPDPGLEFAGCAKHAR